MKKLTENFYSITRCRKKWSAKHINIIKKHLNYSIFKPIPRNFVDIVYGSFNYITNECYYLPPKTIMFNFDSCNGKLQSLRGILCISFDGKRKSIKNGKIVYEKYYSIDLIGNKSIGNGPSKSVKNRRNVIIKSGKDMLDYWINYGKKSKISYIKLNSMENVIGFYWKCGFTFNYKKKIMSFYEKNKWNNIIHKLNNFNLKSNMNSYEEDEYHELLRKYFDKFMEGYYNINYLTKNLGENDCLFNNKLSQKQYDLRFHGYPMYYHF